MRLVLSIVLGADRI